MAIPLKPGERRRCKPGAVIYRAEALSNETFKLLLDAGAKMRRYDNNLASAEKIM